MEKLRDTLKGLCGNMGRCDEGAVSAEDVIVCACYIRGKLTLSQLYLLMPYYNPVTVRGYTAAACRDGYIKAGSAPIGASVVYAITSKGATRAEKILDSLMARSQIVRDSTDQGMGAHRLYANDIYFYLAAQKDGFAFFKEQPFGRDGDILSRSAAADLRQLVADAYVEITRFDDDLIPYEHSVYVEQDMYTQQEGAIKNKLLNYCRTILSNNINTIHMRELIFMLHTADAKAASKGSRRKKGKVLPEGTAAFVASMRYISTRYMGIAEFKVKDLKDYIEAHREEMKRCYGGHRLSNYMNALKDLPERDTLDLLLNTAADDGSGDEVLPPSQKKYVHRRNMIFRYAKDINELQQYFLLGFNINFIANDCIRLQYEYTHLDSSAAGADIIKALSAADRVSYVMMSFRKSGDILHPAAAVCGQRAVIMENISDSLGGFVRAVQGIIKNNDNMCLVAMSFKDCEKLLRALPAYIVPSALLRCRFILYLHTETLYVAKAASEENAFEFEPSIG